jgi:hypothetical protein
MMLVIDNEPVDASDGRDTMWIIELNIVGLQFTHRVPDRRRRIFRCSPRIVHWRPAQLRHPGAA